MNLLVLACYARGALITTPTLSEVRSQIKKLNELIQGLQASEREAATLSHDKVRSTVTNCLEVALKTLRDDRRNMEDKVTPSS